MSDDTNTRAQADSTSSSEGTEGRGLQRSQLYSAMIAAVATAVIAIMAVLTYLRPDGAAPSIDGGAPSIDVSPDAVDSSEVCGESYEFTITGAGHAPRATVELRAGDRNQAGEPFFRSLGQVTTDDSGNFRTTVVLAYDRLLCAEQNPHDQIFVSANDASIFDSVQVVSR